MKKTYLIITVLFISLSILSCSKDDDSNTDFSTVTTFDIFTVQANRTTVIMNGEIKSRTLQDFKNMLAGHPNIDLLQFKNAPGSNDDEINFQVGVLLRQKGINTHLLDNADVASGGVDLFLAGTARTRGENTRLGVHSWSDDDDNQATDFPMDSEEHRANIKYFEDLGYTIQWSSDFYFFTINAAPADDIHWMTEEEITQYQLITN